MKNLLIIFLSIQTLNIHAQTARIEFGSKGLYPEGTVFDNIGERFFVSSATTGTIGTVSPNGSYAVFYQNDSLKSTFGMKIDAASGKLWVCAGDPNYSIFQTPATFRRQIRLLGFDLKNGQLTNDVNLSDLFAGPHFANDLVLDENGNIYITDSYSPVIYKVDAKGKASVLATNELFKGVGIGLNGIAYRKGSLLVVNGASGKLLTISLADPKKVNPVLTPIFLNGGDGLLFDGDDLLVVQNKGINKISRLTSKDDWKTASVVSSTSGNDRFANPSTLTIMRSKVYALNAKLNELTDSTAPKSVSFSLQEVVFH